jgi:hypothetical protein
MRDAGGLLTAPGGAPSPSPIETVCEIPMNLGFTIKAQEVFD